MGREFKSPVKLRGYCYGLEEVINARNEGKILCLRLDTNYNCNLNCRYCYSHSEEKILSPAMPFNKAKDVIDQGVELGLKSIVYLGGGEPTLYPDFWPLLEYMSKKGVIPVMFTNGMLMTDEMAKRLYDLGASVIVKYDGSKEIQEKLTGEGTYKSIRSGFESLLKAGFANKNEENVTRLGAAPCMCTINYGELTDIWRYLRENNIYPNFERATVVGNATEDISLDDEKVYEIINSFIKIDEEEFNIKWDIPYTSMPGHSCYIYLTGCHITADRKVALCPEMPTVASLEEKPLSQIITESPFKEARHIEKHVTGHCSECDHLDVCFGGCRSKAYYCSNSYFDSDPFCTLIRDKKVKQLETV